MRLRTKRRCLVCRLGDDIQKVEAVEVINKNEKLFIRVPLCNEHKAHAIDVLQVMTGEI